MRTAYLTAVLFVIVTATWRPQALAAQRGSRPPRADTTVDTTSMPGMSMPGTAAASPLGVPMSRAGSGTSWLPDAAPMRADHFAAGPAHRWELMLHYSAYLYYDRQNDASRAQRGDDQIGSVNWVMLMARHSFGEGALALRGMMSAEPWTVGARGYPLLLQSGERFRGEPLHDRQHPHDLFMELAADYQRAIERNLAVELYAAPVGEPASGPVAFPHRPSAEGDPFAPLSHHWQDATHITFGVVTAGVFSRTWKLEGSIFNGREPDDDRADFDFRTLDSYALRLTVNPARAWSVSGSYAYLKSPEALFPDDAEQRFTASVLETSAVGPAARGTWSTALIWGANAHRDDPRLSNSALLESSLDADGRNTIFGRLEYVNKSAADLGLVADGPSPNATPAVGAASGAVGGATNDAGLGATIVAVDRRFDLGSLALGYVREIARCTGVSMGVGARVSVDLVPRSLVPVYGSRTPVGFAVYLRVRPALMHMGMEMDSAMGADMRSTSGAAGGATPGGSSRAPGAVPE